MWERMRQWLGWVGPQLTFSPAPFPSRAVTLHPAFAVDDITGFANSLRQFPAFQRQADRGSAGHLGRDEAGSGHGWTWRPHSSHNLPRVPLLSLQSPFLGQMSTVHALRVTILTPQGTCHAQDDTLCSKESTGTKVKGVGRERRAARGAARNGPWNSGPLHPTAAHPPSQGAFLPSSVCEVKAPGASLQFPVATVLQKRSNSGLPKSQAMNR